MKKLSIIFILLLSISQLKAQYTSLPAARFSVVEKSGCAPFTVTINAPECDGSISCTAIYGDGFLEGFQNGVNPPHVYTTAGNYNLQIVFGTSTPVDEIIPLQVTPNIQPIFELYACTGNRVSLKIPDTNYDQYFINYDDGVQVIVPKGSLANDQHLFSAGSHTVNVRGQNLNSAPNCASSVQTIDVTSTLQSAFISQLEVLSASQIKLDYNISPTSNQLNTQYQLKFAINSDIITGIAQTSLIFNSITTTLTGPRTEDNFFCYQMSTWDACTNMPAVPASNSNVICSANFDLNIQSDVNKLTWVTAGSNVLDFSIAKIIDEVPSLPITKLASDPPLHDDRDIVCNTDYCYQLITNYFGSKSISLQKCGTSFSDATPLPVEDISSVVSESGVELTWLQDPGFTPTEYSITKSTNGSFSFLTNTILPTYMDATYSTESLSCYKISYVDACLNSSPPSTEACPMRLSGSLSPNNDITLSWSAYTGWKNGVNHYVIQKYNSQGQAIGVPYDNLSSTTYTEQDDFLNQTYTFVITAFANDGFVGESVSNVITITKEPYFNYPTAFSPRSSEVLNQTFKIAGHHYISNFEMRIFNRWGQEMFYTNDFDIGWDGTYNGSLMPEGTYVFTAKITDQEGKTSDRSGTVVLLLKQ